MRTIATLALTAALLWAQKKSKASEVPSPTPPTRDTIAQKIYQQATRYQDPLTKLYALHYRIATEGSSFGLLDTLAQTYFEAGFYRQTVAIADELLAQQPRNATIAELKALSYFYLQDSKKALDAYEALYEITQDPLHLYQVITLQFNLQRYGECQANIDKLLATSDAGTASVRIVLPDGQAQSVPLRAAAYNVRGVLFRLQKEYKRAKEAFDQALQIAPDFQLAKGNLADMEKELQSSAPSKKN
jgi:tetratricopeptide (TPR) repeat protein